MRQEVLRTIWRGLVVLMLLITPSVGLAEQKPLTIYAGAGLMKPMDELKVGFEQKYKIPVQLVYGGSGELFGMIAVRKAGDVFIPGAAKYVKTPSNRA